MPEEEKPKPATSALDNMTWAPAHVKSSPLLERWWTHIPAMLRLYPVPLWEAWVGEIYQTCWRRVATILPFVLLLLGFVEGVTRWCIGGDCTHG